MGSPPLPSAALLSPPPSLVVVDDGGRYSSPRSDARLSNLRSWALDFFALALDMLLTGVDRDSFSCRGWAGRALTSLLTLFKAAKHDT